MPEVVYYVAASLDGYIATAEGRVDWLSAFEGTEEDYGYAEFYSTVDALLLGSRTYEQILAFGEWPYSGKPAEGGAVPASEARRCDPEAGSLPDDAAGTLLASAVASPRSGAPAPRSGKPAEGGAVPASEARRCDPAAGTLPISSAGTPLASTVPSPQGGAPAPRSGKPCWVFSSRSLAPAQPDVTVTCACPADVMSALEARDLRRAWLVGGGALAASFRGQGLITEYIVSVIPIILGGGIPLFGESGPRENVRLLQSRSYPNGVTQLRYAPRINP